MVKSVLICVCRLLLVTGPAWGSAGTVEMPAAELEDRIQGGLLGQILGNLNGLPHESKYVHAPGEVAVYTPSLPEGARTDDDTDIEWVYVYEIQRSGRILIPYDRIVELWRLHINGHIWCANLYARGLMDLGLEPPLTGRVALNPWANFNISGQFLSEAFGLVAPGMPQTAARIGTHYTRVAIDEEPAQATQLFTGMIATAFVEQDMARIIEAGLGNADPTSAAHPVTRDVLRWWRESPRDWQATWRKIHDKYMRYGGDVPDINGVELNTAAVIASLLYGGGDFVETLRLAFNFGWDADCNAATAGTVVGVVKGRRWMDRQGWTIVDRYRNTTRPGMPEDETITGYGRRLAEVARMVILANGGEEVGGEQRAYRIRMQAPGVVGARRSTEQELAALRGKLMPAIEKDLGGTAQDRARAAYLAICLGLEQKLKHDRSADWIEGLAALKAYPDMLKQVFRAPPATASHLQSAFRNAGLQPATRPAKAPPK